MFLDSERSRVFYEFFIFVRERIRMEIRFTGRLKGICKIIFFKKKTLECRNQFSSHN